MRCSKTVILPHSDSNHRKIDEENTLSSLNFVSSSSRKKRQHCLQWWKIILPTTLISSIIILHFLLVWEYDAQLSNEVRTLKEEIRLSQEEEKRAKEKTKVSQANVNILKEELKILKEEENRVKEKAKGLETEILFLKEELKLSKEEEKSAKEEAKLSQTEVRILKEELKLSKEQEKRAKERNFSQTEVNNLKEELKLSKEQEKIAKEEAKLSKEEVKLAKEELERSKEQENRAKEETKLKQEEGNNLKEDLKLLSSVANAFAKNLTKFFPVTQKLNYNYSLQQEAVTVVFTCSGRRYELLQGTLNSFFRQNTYPIQEIIVVDDDIINDEFNAMKNKFPNITWISTNQKVGQLFAIDIAYKFIRTEYYFHSEEDWQYILPNFIQNSLQIMRNDSKICQVILREWIQTKNIFGIIDPVVAIWTGLSFNPSLKRMSAYEIFVKQFGGYSGYTRFRSFGYGAGHYELCLSSYVVQKGYYGYRLNDQYVIHMGAQRSLGKYWFRQGDACPN